MSNGSSVTRLITESFLLARKHNAEIHQAWSDISFRLGGRLPNSLLAFSIRGAGDLDLVLRCMEDESDNRSEKTESVESFSLHYQFQLSELWIGSIYEVIRLLDERKLMPENDKFKHYAHCLRMLRIPLEKHEIAADKKANEQIHLVRHPLNDDPTDQYVYSRNDPLRSHILPKSISGRGSAMWHVIDIINSSSYWLERRTLSEEFLKL